MTERFKKGSRIQSVWEGYERGGEKEAMLVGRKLVLAETTLKAWMRKFKRMSDGGDAKELKPKTKAPDTDGKSESEGPRNVKGRRVMYKGMSRYIGTVVVPGPSMSEVEWDCGDLKFRQLETNSHLRDAEQADEERWAADPKHGTHGKWKDQKAKRNAAG